MLSLAGPRLRLIAAGVMGFCGVYQVALGVYFIVLRPPLLAEDLRFLGIGPEPLGQLLPRLEPWLRLVFTVLGGQMAGLGGLVIADALRLGAGTGDRLELALLAAAGLITIGTICAVNFAFRSDFRWLLVLPVVAWTFGVALAVSCLPRMGQAASAQGPQDAG